MRTIWVLGDQLNRAIGAMADADPSRDRVLLVEADALVRPTVHRQRLHLVVTAMRRFAEELRGVGFEVDLRQAPTLADGLRAHLDDHDPGEVVGTEPNSRAGRRLFAGLGVEQVRSNQFLTHPDEFARWATDGDGQVRSSLRMEDFYRWQRRRLGYLMDGDEPVSGKWNHDEANREPPPDDAPWPEPVRSDLDDLDREVLARLPEQAPGADPVGWWPTSRRRALARLRHFVDDVLPLFGPHEDAMTSKSWHLGHSLLSPALNLGLLLPGEVCDAVEERFRDGGVPINSAEGFIRQVIGWREFVWGTYWLWPDHPEQNEFGHRRHVPPAFTGEAPTDLACLSATVEGLHDRAWVHHIERLMVLANLANLYGIHPGRLKDWMQDSYVDGAEWVMVPNVFGMATWADGGRMATKPYVSGGAYVNRMSDHCGGCRFDPRKRLGDDACPLTTWYWDFLAEHRDVLAGSHRMGRALANLDRRDDLPAIRDRAADLRDRLARGAL